MPMLKLLIADGTDETRQELELLMRDRCVVKTCADGETALELLKQFVPGILVLDLMLPKTDGLSLLQIMQQWQMSPMVLAQTGINSPYVMDSLSRMGVSYAMQKPCSIKALEVRIQDFMAQLQDAPSQPQNDNQIIGNILMSMGFSPKLDGYGYLMDAIPLYAQDPSQSITKELYVAVGQLRKKEASLVERSIRSAIEKAWKERDDAVWRQFFRPAPDGTIARPSNGTLIARVAHALVGRGQQIHIA